MTADGDQGTEAKMRLIDSVSPSIVADANVKVNG